MRFCSRCEAMSNSTASDVIPTQTTNISGSTASTTFFQTAWKGFIIIPVLMLAYNLWVVAGFFKHAKKTNLLKRCSRRDMNGGVIFKAAITTECIAVARFVTTLAIFVVGSDPSAHDSCQNIIYVNNALFVAPIIGMYVFLWARQRAFYQHPSIGGLFNRSVSVLSKVSVILIVTLILASLCFEMALNRYQSSPVGCIFANQQSGTQYRFFIYAAVLLSGQGMMLGLFIYPLYVHSKTLSSFDSGIRGKMDRFPPPPTDSNFDSTPLPNMEITQVSNIAVTPAMRTKLQHMQKNMNNNALERDHGHTNRRRESKVYGLMRRTLLLACISVMSDISAMAISGFLVLGDTPYYIMCLFLDVDTTVNVTAVMISFKCWREILFFGRKNSLCFGTSCEPHLSRTADSRSSSEMT